MKKQTIVKKPVKEKPTSKKSKTLSLINKSKLNLACGQTKLDGFFGIDKVKLDGFTDAVFDLMIFPWPIRSDSVEEVLCSHFIEHIPHDSLANYFPVAVKLSNSWTEFKDRMNNYAANTPGDTFIAFMNELHRIMKSGGTAKIIGPYWSSVRCWQDPTHCRALDEVTMMYFNKEWRVANKLDHYGITADFNYSYGYDFTQEFAVKAQEVRDYAVRHHNNSVADIHYMLEKK